jgi:hypothetical protein
MVLSDKLLGLGLGGGAVFVAVEAEAGDDGVRKGDFIDEVRLNTKTRAWRLRGCWRALIAHLLVPIECATHVERKMWVCRC